MSLKESNNVVRKTGLISPKAGRLLFSFFNDTLAGSEPSNPRFIGEAVRLRKTLLKEDSGGSHNKTTEEENDPVRVMTFQNTLITALLPSESLPDHYAPQCRHRLVTMPAK
ncbi:hypothetical protein JVU11DRAFT_3863 [Chiua virens]|nr:hypothetical protein JVU11DRAFT_3863 [Chiua virens]